MEKSALYIGVMSGTSLDGIDTALVDIKGDKTTLLAHDDFPLPTSIKQDLLSISLGQSTDLVKIGSLDYSLGHLYADAILQLLNKANVKPCEVVAIGNHGQTVYHQPEGTTPFTMQLGDANIISTRTQITTVADFRRKDMALGGQGAPLVPAFHKTLFEPSHNSVVVLNIGGIANITVLKPDTPVVGYDTGPGNILLDAWIFKQKGQPYDKDGEFSHSGNVIPSLLQQLLKEDYFTKTAPKSTGRELFNLHWLKQQLSHSGHQYRPEDIQATLLELTAKTITDEVKQHAQGTTPELLICGGGGKNPALVKRLTELLPNWRVGSTDMRGVNGDYMEAIAFAWLAYRRIKGLPSNLPEVTGARKAASLGVIYPVE